MIFNNLHFDTALASLEPLKQLHCFEETWSAIRIRPFRKIQNIQRCSSVDIFRSCAGVTRVSHEPVRRWKKLQKVRQDTEFAHLAREVDRREVKLATPQ